MWQLDNFILQLPWLDKSGRFWFSFSIMSNIFEDRSNIKIFMSGYLGIFIMACLFFLPNHVCCAVSMGESGQQIEAASQTGKKAPAQGVDAKGDPQWLQLDPGLQFGEFRLDNSDAKITILRIDPQEYDFVLCNASNDDGNPKPLDVWAKKFGLKAAINASMYLPENGRSTGYMRSGEHENNGRIMERFGGFFVAGPRVDGLPQADILDREDSDWRKLLDEYEIVVQNYRMSNAQRRILWMPGGPLYSISAIGQDGAGHILFIHSRSPVEAYSFVQQLLHLPIDVRAIMYVEGGSQAGLLLKSEYLKRDLTGAHAPSFLVTGNMKARLPNVLGIRPKKEMPALEGASLQNAKN